MSRTHVVIRQPRFVYGSSEQPEVGIFTQTHASRPPVPWGQIDYGDRVLMKWAGGPIVAEARIQGFRQFASCTPAHLRAACLGFGLHSLEEYWRSLGPGFWGMAIYLERERWLDEPLEPGGRSRGASWIVLDDERAWLGPQEPPTPKKPSRRSLPAKLRFLVLRRDGFTCQYCGRRAPEVILHVDHRVPVVRSGPDSEDNLVTACQGCNLGKGREGLHP